MSLKHIAFSAMVLVAGIAVGSVAANAQGPLYDKVIVDLPYAVTINDTVLQPGQYVIRQFDSPGGGSRVLQIFSDNGMKLKTSAMTIPALDNNTPENTRVILHHYGSDYYFDKVWIQGKNYGYEFPLPPAVKARERERMEPYQVAAKYEPTSAPPEPAPTAEAASTPPPAPAPAPAPAPVQEAQNTPPPAPQPAPAPAAMPHTAGNWLGFMLSGGLLSGAGMMLSRLRK